MATIAEIREKYPQYSDMPDAALADALHSKFYSDIPKADFYTKIGLNAAPPAGEGMPQERTTMQEIMQAPAGIYRGFKDVTDTLIKGGASAVDYLAGTNARASVDEAAAQSAREYEKTYGKSTLAGGGRLAGNIVATAPVGAIAAVPLKMAGVAAPIVESVASSGFRTGLAPSSVTTRGIDLGIRGAGGAVTGGASAGLVNPEDTTTGAIVGAAVPTVAAPVLKQFAKSLGFVKDFATGRAGEVSAAEIIRQTLGDQVEPATLALAKARPGITAVQALQEAGIDADPFMALGKLAEKMDTGTAYRLLKESQELAQTNQLAAMVGGNTQTAARESQNVARNALTERTVPMMNTELGAANTARDVMQRLEPTLNLRQDSMVDALQGQGRAATDAAQAGVRAEAGAPGFLTQRTRAAESDVLADTMGVIKAQRGDEAAFIQKQIDSLADYGLKPIDTSNIVSGIKAKLNDPTIGPSDVNQAVLSKVINKIEEWTAKGGGIIDAKSLYAIRKDAVGEEIARLYPNADAKQQARFAAKLLTEIKPAIDDAIVDAGGTGWRRYLQTYETGMKEIDQQKLAALSLEKFKGSKEEFIKLVRGNNPDAVEDIFGPGSFNIFKEMGRKSGQLEDIASQLERDIKVSDRAAAGVGGLARIMGMSEKQIGRIPAFFSVTATTINKTLDVLEGKVTDQVKQLIVDGMKNGKSVSELIKVLPSKDRNVVLRTLMNSKKWNPEGVTAPVQLFVDRANNLAPEQENRNALRP